MDAAAEIDTIGTARFRELRVRICDRLDRKALIRTFNRIQMPSLADLPEVVGFFSYSREDDEAFEGMLSALRDAIQRELSAQLGRSKTNFRLWQDQKAIAPGKLWETEIKKAVEQAVFFIPIVTPRAVNSHYCKFEFEAFLAREQAIGRADLVFPLLYIRVPALESEAHWRAHSVLSIVGMRQYVDWRPLRHLDVRTPAVREQIERFCDKIVEALREPWASPEQRLAEVARQAEEEKQRAEAVRLAEEEQRRAEAARLAEEEKQRAEAALQAEEEKPRAEAARQAKEEKPRAEVARLAEEEKPRAEAARLAEEEKRRAETARLTEGKQTTATAPGVDEDWSLHEAQPAQKRPERSASARETMLAAKAFQSWTHDGAQAGRAEENRRGEAAQRALEEYRRAEAAQRAEERGNGPSRQGGRRRRSGRSRKGGNGPRRATGRCGLAGFRSFSRCGVRARTGGAARGRVLDGIAGGGSMGP